MRQPATLADFSSADQIARYAINGLAAAAVHFGLLYFNINVVGIQSVGLANLFAAVGGVAASFLGSRYFVFREHNQPILRQAAKFGLLYTLIALLHGAVLYGWTDVGRLDYRVGFLVATALQAILSYFGNKFLVFQK